MQELPKAIYSDQIEYISEYKKNLSFNEYIPYTNFMTVNTPFHVVSCGETFKSKEYAISRKNSIYVNVEFILDGELVVEFGNKKINVGKGNVVIFPQGVDHIYYSDPQNPVDKLWFLVTGAFSQKIIEQYELEHKYVFNINALDIFKNVIDICVDRTISIEKINDMVCVEFLKLIHLAKSQYDFSGKNVSKEAYIMKNYIDSHISENITIDFLAKLIFRSTTHATRLFKKAYGVSPYKYISKVRLTAAQSFLVTTDISIKEISYLVGFNDEHYFSNFFYENIGIRPLKFRQRHQNSNVKRLR